MKESDWKIFKEIKQKAIDKFCANVLQGSSDIINGAEEHVHERYFRLYEMITNRDKQMSKLFDYHSRSNTDIQLTLIRKEGLADEEFLNKLSKGFLHSTYPNIYAE